MGNRSRGSLAVKADGESHPTIVDSDSWSPRVETPRDAQEVLEAELISTE